MKQLLTTRLPVIIVSVLICVVAFTQSVHAEPFDPTRIIDDDVFYNNGAMSAQDIQNFLNSKVPSCDTNGTKPYAGTTRAAYSQSKGKNTIFTCLKGYYENSTTHENNLNGAAIPSGAMSAAQIIYAAAQEYNINPQVLIVIIQREQGLITDDWPWISPQYDSATGYGCPDNGPNHSIVCSSQYFGFYNQIFKAAWQLRRYATYPNQYNYVPGQGNYVQWSPQPSCGGTVLNIQNQPTASLYNYAPYQPNAAALAAGYGTGDACSAYANRNFWLYFTDWFGSTWGSSYYTCKNGTNISGKDTGQKILRSRMSQSTDNLSLTIPNNTGTGCVEVHTWANTQLQSWSQHIGSNSYTFDPALSSIISARTSRNSTNFFKVDYLGTTSGKLEVHGWDARVQRWISHTATTSGPVDPGTSEIIPADTDGDGVSELYVINYKNTASGMVEIHGLSMNLQQWVRHTATNLSTIDPAKGKVIAADTNGDGKDEFIYVKFGDTQSGLVELHTWSPDLQQWVRHTATNLSSSGYNPLTADVIAADTNSDGKDELFYVKYSNTSSGRIEVHGWTTDLQQWVSHIATSSGAF